jgi:hypothetical protein
MLITFIFSFHRMNAKIYSIIAISSICIIAGLSYNYYNSQPKDTIIPQCTIENPVWCDEQIEKLWNEHDRLSKIQSELNKKADVYRAIKRLEISPTTTGDTEKLSEPNQ